MLHAGMVDQVAALYGHGCRAIGSGKVTIGTGAFALIVASEGPPQSMPAGSVPNAAWRSRNSRAYAADGGVYTAAAAVDWLLRIGVLRDHSELTVLAGESAASTGAFFVPALAGLAFPHWDRTATGLLIGLDAGTSRETVIKAVLEGIALRIAEVLDGLGFTADAPVPIDGGLSRCSYFTRFLADVSGRPLLVRGDVEVTALGAAQLAAACAAGLDPSAAAAHTGQTAPRVDPTLPPATAAEWRARFADLLHRSRGWRK